MKIQCVLFLPIPAKNYWMAATGKKYKLCKKKIKGHVEQNADFNC